MKVLVTGANGQLGTDLCKVVRDFEVVPLTHKDIEVSDMSSVKQVLTRHKPDIIINTAAYVRVDDCEDEKDRAFSVNALGARNVAVVAQELGARLVHMSTDYVFGGEHEPTSELVGEGLVPSQNEAEGLVPSQRKPEGLVPSQRKQEGLVPSQKKPKGIVPSRKPHPYTEFDRPVPINIYGQSKLAGENLVRHFCLRHFIVRSSALFGVAGSSGKEGNFVETMLRLAKERDELRVVNDQVFSPTYTKDLARKIVQLMTTECYGIFHITNKGACSWYEFAREILKLAGIKTRVVAITSEQYPQKACRPRYSVLDNYHLRLLGMDDMRPWQEALKDYLVARGYIGRQRDP